MSASGEIVKGDLRCVGCGSATHIRVHYGAASCHGCKAFFRRSVFETRRYVCSQEGQCEINDESRNRCRACRLQNCLRGGMNPKYVREERAKDVPSQTSANPTVWATTTARSDNAASQQSRSNDLLGSQEERKPSHSLLYSPPPIAIAEHPLTVFLVSLEHECDQLTEGVENDMVSRLGQEMSLQFGLQHPSTITPRTKLDWRLSRLMTDADLISQWYRCFVLMADWAMSIPDFRALPVNDQTQIFRKNFMSFGWIQYCFKAHIAGYPCRGIPIGNGSYMPYHEEERLKLPERWQNTYGLVAKKLVDNVVSEMRAIDMDEEEYALLKTLALFMSIDEISPVSEQTCSRMRERLVEALVIHIDRRFPHLTSTQRTQRCIRCTLLYPAFMHIGQFESACVLKMQRAERAEDLPQFVTEICIAASREHHDQDKHM